MNLQRAICATFDHLDRSIMRSSQGVHDPAPHASPTPANEL
jgi:hypothetical protein